MIPLGSHLGVKGDLTDDAGGRQHAQIACIQPEQCHLPPLVGEEIGADLTGEHQHQTETFAAAVMDERPLFIAARHRTALHRFPLPLGQ